VRHALLVVGSFVLPRMTPLPAAHLTADVILWSTVAYGAIRLISFLLLDPLLSHRKTATPGFARDLLVVALYLVAAGGVLRQVMQVSLGQLLGTGAIAAAVVGLSLQEVLGNLFAGISLHLDPAFMEGDWVEITGNLRGGPGRETLIGQVEAMTWRTVQLRTENGDMDILPNRIIAQAVVTNLYVPSGLHRRTAKVLVEPRPDLHVGLETLTRALAGLPHLPQHRPEVVVHISATVGKPPSRPIGWRPQSFPERVSVSWAPTVPHLWWPTLNRCPVLRPWVRSSVNLGYRSTGPRICVHTFDDNGWLLEKG
jgi:small-conductance mechanosensitive channel